MFHLDDARHVFDAVGTVVLDHRYGFRLNLDEYAVSSSSISVYEIHICKHAHDNSHAHPLAKVQVRGGLATTTEPHHFGTVRGGSPAKKILGLRLSSGTHFCVTMLMCHV